jgi:hypothetical protein
MLSQRNNYEPGILDEIDFEPLDGDSSNGAGSLSFSDEQPEKLRAGSSVDGSIRASSKRSSRMSDTSGFDIPDAFNHDGNESVGGYPSSQASSRRSKLSMGDDPFGMDEESHNVLFADASLREEPESHPSLLRNHSQQPLSQVPLTLMFFYLSMRIDFQCA